MTEFGRFYTQLNRKVNTWCTHTQRLDTYGCGCSHSCSYCYAKSLLDFRGNWDSENPKNANVIEIKKTVSKLDRNKVVRMGGMNDCFQPLELTHRITYNTIRLLNWYGIHYLIVTKGSIVSNDEYLKIYDKNLAHFQISISSTDNIKSTEFEKCSTVSERINSIETLYNYGFDVSVRLSPFLFQYTDFDILGKIKCNKILIEFLKVNHWTRKQFNINYDDYVYKFGGHDNLPLDKKIKLVGMVNGFDQVSIGEYVKEHHFYFNQNVNYNKDDCCNLNFTPIKKYNIEQLNIFNP